MQNTAPLVFQGEAGGATSGPICSLVDTLPPLVSLYCHSIPVHVQDFSFLIKSLCSVLCSSLSALWPGLYQEICPITHECNFPSNRNASSPGTVVVKRHKGTVASLFCWIPRDAHVAEGMRQRYQNYVFRIVILG
ncbi:unnamed protein product [Pipistrellus nathusii]|uniref:Uncharacterized protein n=1 Tax=Pipistrellus nathusii TaxID=59473 RepID=A0ABN9Z7S9_PIPNA